MNPELRSKLSKIGKGVFMLQYVPKGMINILKNNQELQEQIIRTKKVLGRKETERLLVKYRDEAYKSPVANHEYIIHKLEEERSKKLTS